MFSSGIQGLARALRLRRSAKRSAMRRVTLQHATSSPSICAPNGAARSSSSMDWTRSERAAAMCERLSMRSARSSITWRARAFVLSCREADWLGTNDRSKLAHVAPSGRVLVLRLDPLTDEDIRQILAGRPGIDDAEAFIRTSDEKGISELLRNPQCLDMLATVVGDGRSWPSNRLELFDAACRKMVREHNDEHLAVVQSFTGGLTEDALLDAAGRLCAVQLLASIAGYALMSRQATDDFPAADKCHPFPRVLATKLFSARARGCFSPVHRHVAEFLGARHLARLVGGQDLNHGNARRGLPARRVVSLMTGYDDMVVTELRGLSAWFAAQCRTVRSDLIDRDPIGVGLYGDVSQFSLDEKRALLASLERQTSWLVPAYRAAAAFRALATPEMETAFREVLTGVSQTPETSPGFSSFRIESAGTGHTLPESVWATPWHRP